MDVLKAVQAYVNKMITEVPGMKVLLLDAHTVSSHVDRADLPRRRSFPSSQRKANSWPTRYTSRIAWTSEILAALGADASSSREALNHLSCIAFLSPTDESVELLKHELAKPRYGGYWLCTSCALPI